MLSSVLTHGTVARFAQEIRVERVLCLTATVGVYYSAYHIAILRLAKL